MSYNYIFQKMLFLGYFIIKKELQTSVHSPLSAIAIPISVPALPKLSGIAAIFSKSRCTVSSFCDDLLYS